MRLALARRQKYRAELSGAGHGWSQQPEEYRYSWAAGVLRSDVVPHGLKPRVVKEPAVAAL